MTKWKSIEGADYPLGVTRIESDDSYNFAIYAKHATGVTLNLYDEKNLKAPKSQFSFDPLQHRSGPVWHCRIPAAVVEQARYYGYQVRGPFDPSRGHRFDEDKVLLDPYAKAVFFPPNFSRSANKARGDNAGQGPLGVLLVGERSSAVERHPAPSHDHDTVVYEVHVRGFTKRENSGLAPELRGTFAGLTRKIPHLKELGVTVVELLPIFQFDPLEENYWGYMPLSLFAIHGDYCSTTDYCDQIDEFRTMVDALHEAGIEVILDVVYNHTTEEDELGPTYSFRGIDNKTYYLLESDMSRYRNDAGTGNVLRTGDRAVRQLVLDSLRHWATETHVDGFRFDLASIFTRSGDGSIDLDDPPVISAIRSDPELARRRLIAEAWDLASYQVGQKFPGARWSQWNGLYRDELRRFVRGEAGMVPDIMRRLYGSDDLFPDTLPDSYHPYQSVNFITAHDGFCLYDLVSYNHKRNLANGRDNTDGSDENFSWNCGAEGDEAPSPEVIALRKRQIKNFFALLMLSNGTPMFSAGDEFMNTQKGNNNPYNQDNETTWLDWDLLEKNRDMFRFFKLMIAFRKAHPSIARSRYWREDVRWYGVGPDVDMSYESRSLAYCLSGASQGDCDLYVMINSYWEDLVFEIQDGGDKTVYRALDTYLHSPDDIAEPGEGALVTGREYRVKARSVVALELR